MTLSGRMSGDSGLKPSFITACYERGSQLSYVDMYFPTDTCYQVAKAMAVLYG